MENLLHLEKEERELRVDGVVLGWGQDGIKGVGQHKLDVVEQETGEECLTVAAQKGTVSWQSACPGV